MRISIILILGLLAFKVVGQDAITSFSKIQIGVNVSSDLSYRSIKDSEGSLYGSSLVNVRNDIERPKIGYTSGLNLCYNFRENVGIETGIQFSSKGYHTQRFVLSPSTTLKIIYNLYYLDIPLKLNYLIGKGKLRFITSIGVVSNILLSAQNKSIVEQGKNKFKNSSNGTSDFQKFNLSPMISAGFDYKLSEKINIRVEPTFRYGVLSSVDFPIKEHLWTAGLNIGCYFGL